MPSIDGNTYLTPDYYIYGDVAQSKLALRITPEYRIEIPFSNLYYKTVEIGYVDPKYGFSGGGIQYAVKGPVSSEGSNYVPLLSY